MKLSPPLFCRPHKVLQEARLLQRERTSITYRSIVRCKRHFDFGTNRKRI